MYRDELPLVTAEERAYAFREVTLAEVFQGVCLFVDIRTAEDNRSGGVQEHLSERGINVTTDLTKATHIIFKDGLKSTFAKGKELNLPFVSLLWVDACKKYNALVDYKNYPVAGIERYEDPILCKLIKRKRSMQPPTKFVPRTPKRKRRKKTKVTVEKPIIEIHQNKTETPSKPTDCSVRTPKTIEVTVRASSHARVQTIVQRNRRTVVYSSDEMEVSEVRHEVFTYTTTPKKNRKTHNLSRKIVTEPDVQTKEPESQIKDTVEPEVHVHEEVEPAVVQNGPVNSTRFSAVQNTVPHFAADDISSIILVEDPYSHTPSPIPVAKDPSASSKKKPTLINEETKHVHKPLRKRKLFNPHLTPQEIEHDEKSDVPFIPPTPTMPDDPSPVSFESQSQNLKKLKQTQNLPSTSHQTGQRTKESSRKTHVFVSTGLDKEGRTLLKSCVKQLSSSRTRNKCEIQSFVDKSATHLIMQEPYSKTQKLLLAILHGIWILNVDYLKACLEKKQWLPEEFYEVKNFLPGIGLSRAEREIFGPSYKMSLFSGIKFYVAPNLSVGAQEIKEFIILSNGVVAGLDEANYQIRDELNGNYSTEVQVTPGWITESIGAGHCKNVRKYLLVRRICSQSLGTQG